MDSKIKNVLIVGAGLMGRNIAFVTSSCKTYNITVYDVKDVDRKSTRLNSSHPTTSRMPSSA